MNPTPQRPTIELEAQLTYATALMAGCLWIVWEIGDFSRQTGWDGLVSLFVALTAMSVLELVVLGMAAHIFYRGHWMAVTMMRDLPEGPEGPQGPGPGRVEGAPETGAERKGKKRGKEKAVGLGRRLRDTLLRPVLNPAAAGDEAEELEALCTSLFYRSFRFLHRGLLLLLAMICIRVAIEGDYPVAATGSTLLFVYLVSGPVLKLLGRLLFFLPVIARAARSWEALREGLHRRIGIWQIRGGERRIRPNRLLNGLVVCLFIGLTVINLVWVGDNELRPDKWSYVRGQDERVLLQFRMGGIQASHYVETEFELSVNGRRQTRQRPWHRAGPNRFVCSLPLDEVINGSCHALLHFKGYTVKSGSAQGATTVVSETRFVVLE